MICNNCGMELQDNQNYCMNCEPNVTSNETLEEKMIKAYIGKNQDKMYEKLNKNVSFNIWAFLFGAGYFAYRKMYLEGAIIIIINIVLSLLLNTDNSTIFGIIWSLSFYSIYKGRITKKIEKIKSENTNLNSEQLIEMSRQKGGTSVLGVIVFFLIYFLILCLI